MVKVNNKNKMLKYLLIKSKDYNIKILMVIKNKKKNILN